jgi:hypothetical protein
MAKTYVQWVGIVLVALGLIGFVLPGFMAALSLPVTTLHNLIHLVSGAILLYLGYTGTAVKMGAQIFGIIYTLVGLLGFIGGGTVLGLIPVTMLYNLVHLVIGLLGLYVGFSKQAATA